MPNTFSPVSIDTIQGDDVTTEVIGQAVTVSGSHVVNLDPGGARALAAALLEAADEAELRTLEAEAEAAAAEIDGPGADWPGCRLAARHSDFWHAARDFAPATLCGLRLAGSGLTEDNTRDSQSMCSACRSAVTAALVATGQIDAPGIW